MENIVLEAKKREGTGKGVARKLRKEGYVPAILYSPHRDDSEVSLKVVRKEFLKLFSSEGEHHVVTLKLEDDQGMAVVKEIQRDPVSNELLHVDFLKVFKGEKVIVEVPIELVGEPVGVKKGGILEQILREIEIEAIPSKIPDVLEINITDLELGDVLLIKDIAFPEDVEPTLPEDQAVVSIVSPTKAVEEEVEEEIEEEEGAAPQEEISKE